MQDPDLQTKIDRLAGVGPLKVWSVIVTVLGDLCRDREDSVSSRLLNRLIGMMGISAQAGRVAIHRLKRDGWVEAERHGRESAYRLSPSGWAETKAVWSRVYGRSAPGPAGALLVVGPPDLSPAEFSRELGAEAVVLAPRTALVPRGAAPRPMVATAVGRGGIPDWAAELVAGRDLRAEYAALTAQVTGAGVRVDPDDPVGTMALRLIILHQWRRLCLRHGRLADALLAPDWEGAAARAAVVDALEALPPLAPADLDHTLREAEDPGSTAAAE